MATLLSATIILKVGSHPAQLLFRAAQERMTAQNPPATNGDLGRDQGVPVSTRMYRMGLVWVKLWEQTEVAGKAA